MPPKRGAKKRNNAKKESPQTVALLSSTGSTTSTTDYVPHTVAFLVALNVNTCPTCLGKCLASTSNLATHYIVLDQGANTKCLAVVDAYFDHFKTFKPDSSKSVRLVQKATNSNPFDAAMTRSELFALAQQHPVIRKAEYLLWLEPEEVLAVDNNGTIAYPTAQYCKDMLEDLDAYKSANAFSTVKVEGDLRNLSLNMCRNNQAYKWTLPWAPYLDSAGYKTEHKDIGKLIESKVVKAELIVQPARHLFLLPAWGILSDGKSLPVKVDGDAQCEHEKANKSLLLDAIITKRIETLEQWLKEHYANDARAMFAAGELYMMLSSDEKSKKKNQEMAEAYYADVVALGPEERGLYWLSTDQHFLATLRLARLTSDVPRKIKLLEAAMQIAPNRLEAPKDLFEIYLERKEFQKGFEVGKSCSWHPFVPDGLGVETKAYNWSFGLDFSLCAFYSGEYKDAYHISSRVLQFNRAPPFVNERLKTNIKIIQTKIQEQEEEQRRVLNTVASESSPSSPLVRVVDGVGTEHVTGCKKIDKEELFKKWGGSEVAILFTIPEPKKGITERWAVGDIEIEPRPNRLVLLPKMCWEENKGKLQELQVPYLMI